jgi:hypothetical protein
MREDGMRIGRICAALALILIPLAVAAGGPASGSGYQSAPNGADTGPGVARLASPTPIEMRAQMGLTTDPEAVDSIERDHAVLNPYLHIPLSASETNDIQSREDTGNRFEALEKRMATDVPEFGGVYMDQEAGGEVVIQTIQDTPRLRQGAGEVLGTARPIRFELVKHGRASLKAAERGLLVALGDHKTPLSAQPLDGVTVVSLGVNTIANVIEVGVLDSISAPDAQARLAKVIGVDESLLDVHTSSGLESHLSAQAVRFSKTGLVFGGQRIVSSDGVVRCTATGTGVAGVHSYMITAGHCGKSKSWRQGQPGGNSLGVGYGNGFFDPLTNTTYCDCQAVGNIDGKENNYTLNAVGQSQPETANATTSLYWTGHMVCMSGASIDGVSCGKMGILSYNKDATEFGHTVGLFDQVVTGDQDHGVPGYLECAGDSGGAVTVGATWAGVHVGRRFSATSHRTLDDPGYSVVVECGDTGLFSKLLPFYLSLYTGVPAMRTTL